MTRVLRSRSTRVLRSRLTHFTHVIQLRKTHVLQIRKTHVKYDTMSDFPLLPLGSKQVLIKSIDPQWSLTGEVHSFFHFLTIDVNSNKQ